jgi:23S rRNA pseudouridine2605 synthase
VVTQLGTRADPTQQEISLDGVPVRMVEQIYALALHKPVGVLSTREDDRERSTVMDLIPENLRTIVYPVGRLDYNSSGLMLLTNDGALAHRLTHPSHHIPKRYEVRATQPVTPGHARQLCTGVDIEDGRTAPAEVTVDPADPHHLTITLFEGRKRQIRRMLHAVGNEVAHLQRVAIGPLELGDLPERQWRNLSAQELAALREAAGMRP